jgi:hypothetical protein
VSVHIRDAGDWTHALYEHMLLYTKSVEVITPRCRSQLCLRVQGFYYGPENVNCIAACVSATGNVEVRQVVSFCMSAEPPAAARGAQS